MMESVSSPTNLSASKANFFTAHGTIFCRNAAPGMDWCCPSHAASRAALPATFGMPATPGGRSNTRFASVTANCPSRKKASRGSVATQLGLPRPAFRYARVESESATDLVATLARKSLISNGPSLSNFFRSDAPIWISLRLRQQHDDDHPPDREQRVAHGVGDGVAERGNLALRLVAHEAERGRGGARAGHDAEIERVVEAEYVLGHEHAEHQWNRGGERAPQEQADA